MITTYSLIIVTMYKWLQWYIHGTFTFIILTMCNFMTTDFRSYFICIYLQNWFMTIPLQPSEETQVVFTQHVDRWVKTMDPRFFWQLKRNLHDTAANNKTVKNKADTFLNRFICLVRFHSNHLNFNTAIILYLLVTFQKHPVGRQQDVVKNSQVSLTYCLC